VHVKSRHSAEPLSAEELRTVVHEATGKISSNYQQMLLRILDLEQVTVEDVMIPRNEIVGINLEDNWDDILKQIMTCDHQYVPLYRGNIDKVFAMLNLRKILAAMQQQKFNKETMISLADKVYFIPEGALTSKQLLNFQQEQRTIGLVVDEYSDIQGLVSLQDILEEIVGEFAFDIEDISRLVKKQKDGSYLVSGNISVRELNRIATWDLPTHGPKTLSGLIIEYLEMIPTEGVAARVEGYPMEVVQVSGNRIRQVRVWPELKKRIKT
jgi:Mg2+/Co2+ transporter CorB